MKTKTLSFLFAALAALPRLALAQGTYLSAPDGDPAKALFVSEDGNVAILSPYSTNQVFVPTFLLDVSDYRAEPASTVRNVAEFTSNAQGDGAGTAIIIGVGGDSGVYSTKIAAVKEGRGNDYANAALTFSTMHNTTYLGTEVERMRITSDGRVGIGTTRPRARLDVEGGALFSGNVVLGTTSSQATLDVNGKINCTVLELTSDRNQKQDLAAVDTRRILDRLAGLAMHTWAFTNDTSVRHIGPMAQDWKAAFPDLGSDDKHIAAGDLASVGLAAVQGLNAKLSESLKEKDAEIAELKKQVHNLKTAQANFASRFEELEKSLELRIILCNGTQPTVNQTRLLPAGALSAHAEAR